jgi:hypothetical protein
VYCTCAGALVAEGAVAIALQQHNTVLSNAGIAKQAFSIAAFCPQGRSIRCR